MELRDRISVYAVLDGNISRFLGLTLKANKENKKKIHKLYVIQIKNL